MNRSPAAIIFGQQPDGDYVNAKANGEAFSTNTPLAAGGIFQSDWIDTDGWSTLELIITSDQESASDGIEIQFTDNVQASTPTVITSVFLTFGSVQVQNNILERIVSTRLDGFRLKYTNGSIGQNEFFLAVTLRTVPIDPRSSFDSVESGSSNATLVKGPITAENDLGIWDQVKRSDQGGLRVAISEYEAEVPIAALSNWEVGEITVGSVTPVRISSNPLSNRKTIIFKNNGSNNLDVFIGPNSSVTTSTGFPLGQFEVIELEINPNAEFWAITQSSGGSTNTQNLSPNSTNSNTGVTDPDNVFTSNDVRAVFDATGDKATYNISDFTFSGTFNDISSVKLKVEARRVSGGFQTVAHQESVETTGSGGTAITSPLISSGNKQCYVVFVSNGSTTPRAVTSVTGGNLTWIEVGDIVNSSSSGGISCWIATGSPSTSFTVTASFSGAVSQKAISVHRYSGVNQVSPVQSSDLEEAPGSGSNTITSDVIAGTPTNGRFIAGINSINREPNLTSPGTVRADLDAGGQVNHEVNDSVAASNNQVIGTTTTNPDWILIALALAPAEAENPQFTLTYEVGSEGVGETSLVQSVSQTSDTTFELDITSDRVWTDSNLDNLKVTVESTLISSANLEVDHIFVEVIETTTTNTQRCAFIEIA